MEKTVDITVAKRLKKRGMSLYKDGANPLLKLRLLRLNGDWDNYWSKRKKDCACSLPHKPKFWMLTQSTLVLIAL